MSDAFIFDSYSYVPGERLVEFTYIVVKNNDSVTFKEKMYLPDLETREIPDSVLQNSLQALHIVFGINYWKMHCIKEIQIHSYFFSKSQADFWNTIYTKGLGEFFYKNGIHYNQLIRFPFDSHKKNDHTNLPLNNRILLGIGGGKDSIVSAELLKKAGLEFDGLIIETQKDYRINRGIVDVIPVRALYVKREIDQKMFLMNKLNTSYTGHIPVSAIYACVGVFVSLLYGYSSFIVSNEYSANFGNVSYLGESMNHQWSKSAEFERLFQSYIQEHITESVSYFSLLRPYSELKIANLFSAYPQYFKSFSSCNKNFSIMEERNQRWCGDCPKCIFVFVLLSAFLEPGELLLIFEKNYYDREEIIPLLRILAGLEGHKPFECVGTPEEVKAALYLAYKSKHFATSNVMKFVKESVLPTMKNPDSIVRSLFQDKSYESIPQAFRSIVH